MSSGSRSSKLTSTPSSSKKSKKGVKKLGLINVVAPPNETAFEPTDLVTPEVLKEAFDSFEDVFQVSIY